MERSEIAQLLFRLATLPFIALGLLHALLSLLDVAQPRFFTPANDQMRQYMNQTGLKLTHRTTMWRAWLGFNISHGLGLLVFGLICFWLAMYDFELVVRLGFLMPLTVIVSMAYFMLSIRFWFYVPTLMIAIGGAGFILCYMLI